MSNILKDLLEVSNPFNGKTPNAAVKVLIKKLESYDSELLKIIDKMKKLVESGEYDAARLLSVDFERLSKTANALANRLADLDI